MLPFIGRMVPIIAAERNFDFDFGGFSASGKFPGTLAMTSVFSAASVNEPSRIRRKIPPLIAG
jgi:hypothetical protein